MAAASFLVPALVLGFGLLQQVAQGTALLALIPIWIIGALTHHKTHTLGLREAATLGSVRSAGRPVLGAEIASHVGALPLRAIFAAFLIATVGWGLVPHVTVPPSRRRRHLTQRLSRRRARRASHPMITEDYRVWGVVFQIRNGQLGQRCIIAGWSSSGLPSFDRRICEPADPGCVP